MRPTAQEIEATAGEWVARADGGLTNEDTRALETWLQEDPRHHGAFMRLRGIALHTERARALGVQFDPHRFAPAELLSVRANARRSAWWLAGAAVAACVLIALLLPVLEMGDRYDTRRGEMRVVPLADGSTMTLNTASRVLIAYEAAQRRVKLIEGEALFEVAKDPTRPFVVEAGSATVRALGTSFTVSRLRDRPVQVIVRDGLVEVRQDDRAPPVRMAANTRALVPQKVQRNVPQPQHLAPEVVNRELAWRDGQLAFESEPLALAAAAFERYSATRIVIEDAHIARREITGLFTANDPVGFARAAAASLGLQAEIGEEEVRLRR